MAGADGYLSHHLGRPDRYRAQAVREPKDSPHPAPAISVDATGVYVTGLITVEPGHHGPAGSKNPVVDIFVRKYNARGSEAWARQFGPFGGVTPRISGDAKGVYLSVSTFLRKYDPGGAGLWTRQFGFGSAYGPGATAISIGPGGVYVAGFNSTPGQTGRPDAFVRKYDPGGNELWTQQFGTTDWDKPMSISAHPTGLYVAGSILTSSIGGSIDGSDAFLAKLALPQ